MFTNKDGALVGDDVIKEENQTELDGEVVSEKSGVGDGGDSYRSINIR